MFKNFFVDTIIKTSENQITETQNTEDPEKLLIQNNIKIKNKYSTKFGIQFDLAKNYDKEKIKKVLKDFDVIFKDTSIFVKF